MLESCGVTGLALLNASDLLLRVNEVWLGTAEDSIIRVTVMDSAPFLPRDLDSTSRVLMWGYRECDDGWKVWGALRIVTPDGLVLRRAGDPESVPVRLDSLRVALTASPLHPSRAFEGRAAVALARLVLTTRGESPGTATYLVDSLAWAMGSGPSVPRSVDWPHGSDCYPFIFPSDSLLIPVPQGFTGDGLSLTFCPRVLGIQHGYLPGLGVALGHLEHALQRGNRGLHVRPFLSPKD